MVNDRSTNKRKLILIALVVALIIFSSISLFLFNKNRETGRVIEETETLRIGYLAIAPDLSFFVALDQGYFEDNGLDIKPYKFGSSNQAIDALLSDQIDGTSVVALEALISVQEKYPNEFKIFEMTAAEKDTEVHKIIVRKDSDIFELSDLEGKKIGTYPGSQMRIFTNLILQDHLDVSKVNIIQMKPSLQAQALASGQVDALFTLEPIGTIAESKGISKTIEVNPLYDEVLKPFPTAASAFSQEFASDNKETTKRYLKAIEESHSLSKYTSIDESLTSKVGIYSYWNRDQIDLNAVDGLIELYLENNIIDSRFSAEDMILVN